MPPALNLQTHQTGNPVESIPHFGYWGKARPSADAACGYHLLAYHCLDVAAVGAAYVEAAPGLRRWWSQALGLQREDALVPWVAFCLCLHDLGKFAEAFQGQREDLMHLLQARTPRRAYSVRHDTLGWMLWVERISRTASAEEWLGPDTDARIEGLDAWFRAVTGHHGQPPQVERWELAHHFDPSRDLAAVDGFVRCARGLLLGEQPALPGCALDAAAFCTVSQRLSWWVAGLAVLADWIGSNTDYFPYRDRPLADGDLAAYWVEARERARRAIAACGVVPGAAAQGAGLRHLFPSIAHASPLQAWAGSAALADEPALYLLEDVTGAGKTEAAVLLAHRLMARGLANGLFVALPTMATANAMYQRVAEVFARLFAGDANLVLAHGMRDYVEAFAATVLPPGVAEGDENQQDQTASARCSAWLADHNKRALLAAGGVGTVDQAMLGVLHSRHQSLRLLGLFGKVLIVDEVHACDSYMQRVLEALLEFHAYAGGSAILLSATLPGAMKQSLLASYSRGRALAAGARAPAASLPARDDYPLATWWHAGLGLSAQALPLASRPQVCRRVAVRCLDDAAAVADLIVRSAEAGRCVCWIRNTVADAVGAFEELRSRIDSARLTLFHARFALHDRLGIEQRVLSRFGKASTAAQRQGQVVIATQVVEQSLDADWDVLITDLAPIDRVIQRAGRLQRHVRDAHGNPVLGAGATDGRGEPCLWVHAPAWADEPQKSWYRSAFPKAADVYPNPAQLWLTARLLRSGELRMPGDARRWIESVFDPAATVPATLAADADRAQGDQLAARAQGGASVVKLTKGYERDNVVDWWSEARTPTRLGEAASTVVLACRESGRWRPWADRADPAAAWAYSSLRVAARLIASRERAADDAEEAALAACEAALPGGGVWSVLLPLEPAADGRWRARALTAEDGRRPSRRIGWSYSPEVGLVPLADDEQEASD